MSVGRGGVQGNDFSQGGVSISADGRFVAFDSAATNLAPGDTNEHADVFIRDRRAGTTIRVSHGPRGALGNRESFSPDISADGRVVAFTSAASNLVRGDTNGVFDIFVHAR